MEDYKDESKEEMDFNKEKDTNNFEDGVALDHIADNPNGHVALMGSNRLFLNWWMMKFKLLG